VRGEELLDDREAPFTQLVEIVVRDPHGRDTKSDARPGRGVFEPVVDILRSGGRLDDLL
jgi:hypothetical protein